jgi:hypothetical protein
MIRLALFSILFILASCAAKDENYYMKTDVIEINKYSIPDSSGIFDTIQIEAEAEEPNACWKNLNFVLSKDSDFNFHLKAFGTFETNGGLCPAEIVSKHTIIRFQPRLKGQYLFHIIINPQTMIVYTMIVK